MYNIIKKKIGGSQRSRDSKSRHSKTRHSKSRVSKSRNSKLRNSKSRVKNSRAHLRNSQKASRRQARQSKYRRNPLSVLAEAAEQIPNAPRRNPLSVLTEAAEQMPDPRGQFVPLPVQFRIPQVPIVPQAIPEFTRYIPTMPDGRMIDATGTAVVPRLNRVVPQGRVVPPPDDVIIPPIGDIPRPPPGPIPAGVPTNTASGSSKKVFFHPNSNVAYITSTLMQMRYTQDTDDHFREELLLTQIENFLFPDLVLGAYDVGPENQERIQSYRQTFPDNIFIYKKRKVLQCQDDSPGIVQFILDSIRRFSENRLGAPFRLCFTNLDIKPENIGILNGEFIYLDNGSVFLYPIHPEFREYYERASLIIGLCNLSRVLTGLELRIIRPRLSRRQLYETFNRVLTAQEIQYIRDYARQFFVAQGLPLTAANDVRLPQEMMRHYCRMDNTRFRYDDFMGKFREITNFNRLDRLL